MSLPLLHYLKKYSSLLDQEGVEEIMINKPGVMFVEKAGRGIQKIEDPDVTFDSLQQLSQLIASYSNQAINKVDTLLSASLPTGERIQIVMPPSCEPGCIYFAIRKPSRDNHTLESLEDLGVFDRLLTDDQSSIHINEQLQTLLHEKDFKAFLQLAVQSAKNIVISGGTSSGKTTLANALLKHIPINERIITLEDVREVVLDQENTVHLLASKGSTSTAKAGVSELFGACLRLRPDRIMLSEIRGAEAYDFLNTITSGHPGAITTIHADSPRLAVERLARYVGDHPSGRLIANKEAYIQQAVDIIVQVRKDLKTGWRGIVDIEFTPN